jgi:spermidine synthase
VTDFQTLDVVETHQFGNLLVLDGMVMTTDKDECVYHEMISHVALHTHPNPKQVLIVGGGDGGVVREVLKHSSVERVVLAEIDGRVIEASKEYFPAIASGLSDPRVDIQVVDGIRHIEENPNTYDVVVIDSTEPVGPAVGLFQKPFYQKVSEALKSDGIMVAQTESPWFNRDLIRQVYADISSTFAVTRLYTASIPTYPSGLWSFTLGSKQYDPLEVDETKFAPLGTKYYQPNMHKSLFQLPVFVQELTENKE